MSIEYLNTDKRAFLSTRKSPSCAHKLDYHYVFATEYRREVLESRIAEALRDIIIELCTERKWLLLGLSIQSDHIHVILGLRPSESPAAVARDLKGASSYQIIALAPELRTRLGGSKLWDGGYSVETLGRSNVAQITAYLQTQEAHHSEQSIDVS